MGAIVRISHHREIPRHVNTSDEKRSDIVAMLCAAGEGYPGIVVALNVFLKDGFELNVFPISAVLCDQGRSLFLGEFKRGADTRLQGPMVTMRNPVGAKRPI